MGVSEAQQRTPGEVLARKAAEGALKAEGELTQDDRRRRRLRNKRIHKQRNRVSRPALHPPPRTLHPQACTPSRGEWGGLGGGRGWEWG